MLNDKLKNFKIILASASPRRQTFFKDLNLDFEIQVKKIQETYPENLVGKQITDYLAELKASSFSGLNENELLVTSDTIVWFNGQALGKPQNFKEAKEILQQLSGNMHEVITSVSFTSNDFQKTVNDTTKVWFNNLSDEEIEYYIETYKPFDKAGSYGIQEWIGYIGVEKIEGCYFNVMGLPVRLVYKTLSEIGDMKFM